MIKSLPSCVLLFSTADWKSPYWTNKQHTALQFNAHNCPVLYIESFGLRAPGGNKRDIRRIFKRLIHSMLPSRRVREHVWVLSPLVFPLWHIAWVRKINQLLVVIRIRIFCFFAGFKNPMLWTYHPLVNDLLDSLPYSSLVYHSVDDLSAVPGIDAELIQHHEGIILSRADYVFTTSPALKEQYQTMCDRDIYYFSNVADKEHFAPARTRESISEPTDIQHIPHPRMVYHGVMSDFKLDFELLRDLVVQNPWHWVFIGDEREGQENPVFAEICRHERVHHLGYRSYHALPAYLAYMDVGILPSQINDYTKAMFPMKFFEYLLAGLPVVATKLPALSELEEFFFPAPDAEIFSTHIRAILAMERSKRSIALNRITEYTWEGRFEKMMNIIMKSRLVE